jgi:5-enolpyruvylshikimate-3-phosphate synthase
MKRKYKVLLPIDVDGQIFEFGQIVELDMETASQYSHALIAVEEEEHGRNS